MSDDDKVLTCSRCGRSAAGEARCACGAWLGGNMGALQHGAYSATMRQGATPDAKASMADKRANLLTDRGGRDAVTQVTTDAVERYVELDLLARSMISKLAAEGPFTPTGRARAALQAYLSIVDRWHRVAVMLGMERRAHQINIIDQIAEARAEGERQRAQTPPVVEVEPAEAPTTAVEGSEAEPCDH